MACIRWDYTFAITPSGQKEVRDDDGGAGARAGTQGFVATGALYKVPENCAICILILS